MDLAHRHARKPGLLVVDRGRRVPLGGYLNGVAAWGRDDVLGCERSLYAAVDQGCPFVSTRRVAAADVSAPDWRTCSPAPPLIG